MKFSKVIGCSTNPETKKIIQDAADKLSSVFTELSLGIDNKSMGSGLGGDPLVFQLVYSLNHYVDITSIQLKEFDDKMEEIEKKLENGEPLSDDEKPFDEETKSFRRKMGRRVLHTAATSGAAFWWAPKFVNKLSKIGLRIVVFHEAFHAIYQQPSRRGSRLPRLWNVAIDYKVNNSAMEDLRARGINDYPKVFTDNLGEYIHLEEYAQFLENPFNPPPRLAHLNPIEGLKKMADPAYADPYGDVGPMYYADEVLSDDMKRPENVYDYLLSKIPKCPKCGRLGKYKKPEEYKQLQKKIKEQEEKEAKKKEKKEKKKKKNDSNASNNPEEQHDDNCGHNHDDDPKGSCNGSGEPQDGETQTPGEEKSEEGSCCGNDCPECNGDDTEYIDPFGAGETLDEHIDSDVSEEELAKRITDATEMAKRMGGKTPGFLEDELGILTSPKITWEDIVRQQMTKKRNDVGRADWTKPRSRPMFAGLYTPKKRDHFLNILCAYDCSGSMSSEDISYGISQLQVIDDRGEIWLLPFDTKPYYDKMIKIKKADTENLLKTVVCGRGGTMINETLSTYKENTGPVDMIIIVTDSFLADTELRDVKIDKGTTVLWLVTAHNPGFKPPFGRVMHIRNES